mmetsp:Transcript_15808/g.22595  ORF Transcript_15808/g.22595 Transcript_15808/m.22595 type:complete len:111 (-) Transcript_15808:682-1014(-)
MIIHRGIPLALAVPSNHFQDQEPPPQSSAELPPLKWTWIFGSHCLHQDFGSLDPIICVHFQQIFKQDSRFAIAGHCFFFFFFFFGLCPVKAAATEFVREKFEFGHELDQL